MLSWGWSEASDLSVLIRSKVAGGERCLQPRSALSFVFISSDFSDQSQDLEATGFRETMKKNQKNKCKNKAQEVTERGGDEIFHLV